MLCVIVLRSHQLQGSVRNAGANNNLIPGLLGRKLTVALTTLKTLVFRAVMLGDGQQEAFESSSEREPES